MTRKLAFTLLAMLLVLGATAAIAIEGSEPVVPAVEEPTDDLCEPAEGSEEGASVDESDEVVDDECEEASEEPGGEESEGEEPEVEVEVEVVVDTEEPDTEESNEGMPPFLTGDKPLPPGLAAMDELPYGLAKKLDPTLLPPGLRTDAPSDEEGEEVAATGPRGGTQGFVPPGLAKKAQGGR